MPVRVSASEPYKRGKYFHTGFNLDYPDGRVERLRESTGQTNKQDATIWIYKRIKELENPEEARQQEATIEDCIKLYIKEKKKIPANGKARSLATIEFIQKKCDAILRVFNKDKLLKSMDELAIADYIDKRYKMNGNGNKPIKPLTVKHEVQHLLAALKLAYMAKLWNGDVSRVCVMPDGFRGAYEPKKVFLTIDETWKLIKAFESNQLHNKELEKHIDYNPVDRACFIAFSCAVGTRFAETTRAMKSHIVKLQDGTYEVSVIGSKNKGATRTVPIVAKWQIDLIEYILKNKEAHDEAIPLFKKWANEHGNREIKRAAVRCGITKPISFHVLRKTFGSIHKQKGVPVDTIFPMLGHTTARMAESVYCEETTQSLADKVKLAENNWN